MVVDVGTQRHYLLWLLALLLCILTLLQVLSSGLPTAHVAILARVSSHISFAEAPAMAQASVSTEMAAKRMADALASKAAAHDGIPSARTSSTSSGMLIRTSVSPAAVSVAMSTAGPTSTTTAEPTLPPTTSTRPATSIVTTTVATGLFKRCKIRPCELFGPEAPRLYVIEHLDGSGHRMKTILEGMAVAFHNKMNFGGSVAQYPVPGNKHITDHGDDFIKVVDGFFGNGAAETLLLSFEERPKDLEKLRYESVRELENRRTTFPSSANVFCPNPNEWYYNYDIQPNEYFSGELLKALRGPMEARPLQFFKPGRPGVAFHVRRGDLPKDGHFSTRALPETYFFHLADLIRKYLPTADIHVWSNVDPYPITATRHWNSSDFDSFRARDMTCHLDADNLTDGNDLVVPWLHMARARVFVASPSSFSSVPAYLNPNCVIYPGMIDRPFKGWMLGLNPERQTYEKELHECILRGEGSS